MLFNAPMIRAVLAGTKGPTRRPVKAAAATRAEGVLPFFSQFPEFGRDPRITSRAYARGFEPRASFAVLWDSIDAAASPWIRNDWIFASTFKREAPA